MISTGIDPVTAIANDVDDLEGLILKLSDGSLIYMWRVFTMVRRITRECKKWNEKPEDVVPAACARLSLDVQGHILMMVKARLAK